jgi:hypothetical protein
VYLNRENYQPPTATVKLQRKGSFKKFKGAIKLNGEEHQNYATVSAHYVKNVPRT